MTDKKEFEIVRHAYMNYLEIFLVEMTTRRPHGHDDLEMGIVLDGDLTLFTERERYDLHKGYIYIINRHQVHSFSSQGGKNLILAFQVHSDFYRKLNYELGFLRFENNIIRSGHLHKQLMQYLLSCAGYYFQEAPFNELKCYSLLLETLYLLLQHAHYTIATEKEYSAAQKNSLRINRITEYISAHYKERISLEDIAEMEMISSYHVSHFIKDVLGVSFQEYLNHIRFDHALRLIQKTSLNILDICMESGFSGSKYLNQMFQKNFGCTAVEYRKMAKKPEYKETAIPIDSIQTRYSFEKSAFEFQKLFPQFDGQV